MVNGKWIWTCQGLNSQPEYVLFRKEAQLTAVPEHVFLTVSADSRYILWINGRRVCRGPARCGGPVRYTDRVDIAPYLRVGTNTLAADVIHYVGDEQTALRFEAGPSSVRATGQGGFLIQGDPLWSTDGSYACLQLDGYSFHPARIAGYLGFFEELDGSRYPCGYRESGFAAAGWQPAVEVDGSLPSAAYGVASAWQLQPRPIPFPEEREARFVGVKRTDVDDAHRVLGEGITVPAHTRVFLELDAGDYVTGYPVLSVTDGVGSRIQLTYAECYQYEKDGKRGLKGRRDDCALPGSYLEGDSDVYVAGSGQQTYMPYHYRAFRFIRVDISTGSQSLTLRVDGMIRTGYPLEVASAFSCDREEYARMWDISLHTLRSCMYETYMDCPHYEQMQYVMDTRLEALFTHAISRDGRLARKAILDFYYAQLPNGMMPCNSPSNFYQIIPGFALYWIAMLEDYYMYHGDEAFLRSCLPGVEKILLYFRSFLNADGLLDNTGFWQFVDWTAEWERGVPIENAEQVNVPYCLMFATFARTAARLATALGRRDMQREYVELAERLIEAVNRTCVDPADGLYCDTPGRQKKSQQTQIWAVLSGAAEGERARWLMQTAVGDPSLCRISFCMQYFLCRALETTGLYALAESEWSRWIHLLDYGLFTWPEDDINWRSDCHAWSAAPLYEFVACGLGVTPAAPGFRVVRVAPKMLWLHTCAGKVQTPYGTLAVEWQLQDGQFTLTLHTEVETPLQVELPDGRRLECSLHGEQTFTCLCQPEQAGAAAAACAV